jgi:t-SNARE complex subunit (syntaxin)
MSLGSSDTALSSSKFYHLRHRPENDGTVEQRQAQIFQTQLSSAELAHQETLIQEREHEIREIETGIHELHEIFRDLGTIVQEQGEMIGSQST